MAKEAGGGATRRPVAPIPATPGQQLLDWNGVTITKIPDPNNRGDYMLFLPGGEKLPRGSSLNPNKKTIDLPDGRHLSFRGGKIYENTPIPKRDMLAPREYNQREYGSSGGGGRSGDDQDSRSKPPRSGDDRRTPVGGGASGGGGTPAGGDPAVAQRQRELNAVGADLVVDGIMGPATRAAEKQYGPLVGAGGSAGGAADGAVGGGTGSAAGGSPGDPGYTSPTTPEMSDEQIELEVRRMFGDVASFLDHPELGPILRQAAKEGWDNSRLFGALQQTTYWKTTPDTARKWTILNTLDPATAKRQKAEQTQAVRDLAAQQGLTLSDEDIDLLAEAAAREGWSSSELRTQLYQRPSAQQPGGMATAITTQFGYLAVFLGDPEVGPLLQRAAQEGWSPQRLEAELVKTDFWRTTTESQRKWDALVQQSPQEAEQQIAARKAEIVAQSRALGIDLDPTRLQELATDSVRFGWSGQQLRDAVTADFDYQGGEGGLAGQSNRQIKELAGQYLVPLSDSAIDRWTEQIVIGAADEESFRAYLTEQAKSLFPGMAAALDKGITVAQYADPYKQIAARELEVAPETIDLNDPRYRKMLDQVDSKGNRTAMTLSSASEYLRSLPEWQQTRGANEKAASLTENILKQFGAIA